MESSARDLAKSIVPFSLSKFESLIKGEDTEQDEGEEAEQVKTVNHYFKLKIDHHLIREAISTAESYQYALKCLLRFAKREMLEFQERCSVS